MKRPPNNEYNERTLRDLSDILPKSRIRHKLKKAKDKKVQERRVSFGVYNNPEGLGGTGSGVASPFTEKVIDQVNPNDTTVYTRKMHPEQTIFSSDGFFSIVLQNVKSLEFLDLGGSEIKFDLSDPEISPEV